MVKTFLFIPTILVSVWLAMPFEFNFTLTSENPISDNFHISDCENTIIKSTNLCLPADYKVKTIVIDAGHGGRDGGCSGHNSREKEITLKIAKKLKEGLTRQFPSMNVYLTREKDVFIPLHKRSKFANEKKADVFLSIHCNFIPKADHIHGSESYVLGLHKAEDNLQVAKRENEVVYLEEDYEQNYGVDPNSPAGHILLSAFQNAHLEQSILFAEKIEEHIKRQTAHKSRGVRQAGFHVLRETTMPSVLLESGYLSNAKDEAFLLTDDGQNQIATAIINAFFDYKIQVETDARLVNVQPSQVPSLPVAKSPEPQPLVVQNVMKPIKEPELKPQPAPQMPAKEISPTPAPISKAKEVLPVIQKKGINYKVQISASQSPIKIQNHWNQLGYLIEVVKENNYYKYQIGGFKTYKEVQAALHNIKAKGFKECFVVVYNDGLRVSLQEAKAISAE